MAEKFYTHMLDNGMMLLGERVQYVNSVALNIALPAGASRDGAQLAGGASVLSEWLFRGAGDRDSRQLNEALDSLGCQHDESVHSEFMRLSCSLLNQNLRATLEIYSDVLRRPHLADASFAPCRDLVAQDLAGLDDEPTRRCNMRLRERFYPVPLGANPLGQAETLRDMTHAALRRHAEQFITPRSGVLAVAGKFEWDELLAWAEELFAPWQGPLPPDLSIGQAAAGVTFEQKNSSQVQISLAFSAPLAADRHYYPMRVAEMVLSGGMSGRLFTEVREKRGLVYHVSARYQGTRSAAGVFVYAGTAPDRAQQTLDVTVAELKRLAAGIDANELTRAKTQLKAALIMQGESTSARAGGLVSDWCLLERLRSLEEIAAAVDVVTANQVVECLAAYPADGFTAYFIGPEPLDTSCLGGV